MKVLIIDDERLARDGLNRLLGHYPTINIVGDAKNIEEAQNLVETLEPDLLLLDITMPGGDGFQLLENLTWVPHVVFTTAYSEYAVKAFAANALDYLVKPIEEDRLRIALEKAERSISSKHSANTNSLDLNNKIFLKEGEQCWFVPISEILFIESIGNYSRIYFGNHKPMIKKSLNSLESRLPRAYFFRANRNQIININKIRKTEINANGNIDIELINKTEIQLSRRQTSEFKLRMSL